MAPAFGLIGTGLAFGIFKLKLFPPRPSPFFKILVPVAAIETSYWVIGLTSVTPLLFLLMYSFGKSPKAECCALGKFLL
jgi:hypothetical protein